MSSAQQTRDELERRRQAEERTPNPSAPTVGGKALRYIVDDGSPIALATAFVDARHTRDGIAQIARYAGDSWCFEPTLGHYVAIEDEDLAAQLRAFLDETGVREVDKDGNTSVKPVRVTTRIVSEVREALNDDRRPRVSATATLPIGLAGYTGPAPRTVLVVRNGLVHLETGKQTATTPLLFATCGSAATFDPAATCTEWQKFLESIFVDETGAVDHETIELLRLWFGYLLTTDTGQQKILLVIGPRRSGKGTIARVLRELLGDGNVAAPTLSSLQSPFGLASLVGKSLAIVGDARIGRDPQTVAERLLSISGQDAITVDRKFKPAVDVRLATRIVIISNELPNIGDASGALASRFSIVETRRSFLGAEDLELERRLLAELPGILNWSIAGWRDLQRCRRFPMPARAAELADEMEAIGSPIKAFALDELEVGPGREAEVSAVWERWKGWCDRNGRREAGTVQSFGRNLRAAIPAVRVEKRRSLLDDRQRWYLGLAIRGRA